MTSDWSSDQGDYCGVEVWATPEGLWIGGWYDSFVGIGARLLPWATVDELRKKSKRRKPWIEQP